MSMYREHRQRFLERLRAERAAAVLPTSIHKIRNHDTEYRFRPDSDFWYLTGFAEPEAVLVLLPFGASEDGRAPDGEPQAVLFARAKNREEEVWTGRRLGLDAAPAELGVDRALPSAELWKRLPELLRGYERIVWRAGDEPERDQRFLEVVARLRRSAKRKIAPPLAVIDPAAWLHEQRLFKSAAELSRMRRAAAISVEAHRAAMAATRPGGNEREIEALLEYTFRSRGGTGPAYGTIVAGGANACVLHYVSNESELRDGDLLLVDAGCEVDYYASDVTRTWPVNGRFSPEQRAVYDVVLTAQKAVLELVRPGTTVEELNRTAVLRLVEGLVELGLLEGPTDAAVESESYKRFYMHGVGHWLGLDVHDCGAYQLEGGSRALEPGMVTTVEPGLYIAEDDETVEPRWRGIGVRIEDDVLVTSGAPEILTDALPREPDEVESACGEAVGALF